MTISPDLINRGWKECKLGDITCKIGSGATPTGGGNSYKPFGITLIRSQNVQDFYLDTDGLAFIDQDQAALLNNVTVEKDDILLNITGESVTRCCLIPSQHLPARVNQHVSIIRPIKMIADFKYIFYYLQSIKSELNSIAEIGCTRRALTKEMLENLLITLPPLPEQRAIAGVLSSLDDKIDLLHRQNKTLEAMAETLWQKMFVEDYTYSKIISLGDIIEIYDSKRIPLSSMQREKMKEGFLYPYYGAATIMDYINQFIFDGEYLLLGEDGTVETEDGYPILQLATDKFWVNNHTHVLRAKKPFSNFLLYVILKNTSISHIVTGAVQPKINQENLKSLEISSSKDMIVDNLSVALDHFWQKIQSNKFQIRTITQLRDELLPKLMSGEVRVNI